MHCGYTLETPQRGGSEVCPQGHCFAVYNVGCKEYISPTFLPDVNMTKVVDFQLQKSTMTKTDLLSR